MTLFSQYFSIKCSIQRSSSFLRKILFSQVKNIILFFFILCIIDKKCFLAK